MALPLSYAPTLNLYYQLGRGRFPIDFDYREGLRWLGRYPAVAYSANPASLSMLAAGIAKAGFSQGRILPAAGFAAAFLREVLGFRRKAMASFYRITLVFRPHPTGDLLSKGCRSCGQSAISVAIALGSSAQSTVGTNTAGDAPRYFTVRAGYSPAVNAIAWPMRAS